MSIARSLANLQGRSQTTDLPTVEPQPEPQTQSPVFTGDMTPVKTWWDLNPLEGDPGHFQVPWDSLDQEDQSRIAAWFEENKLAPARQSNAAVRRGATGEGTTYDMQRSDKELALVVGFDANPYEATEINERLGGTITANQKRPPHKALLYEIDPNLGRKYGVDQETHDSIMNEHVAIQANRTAREEAEMNAELGFAVSLFSIGAAGPMAAGFRGLGMTAAQAGASTGATLGGLSSAVTGNDVGKGIISGAIGGGISGYASGISGTTAGINNSTLVRSAGNAAVGLASGRSGAQVGSGLVSSAVGSGVASLTGSNIIGGFARALTNYAIADSNMSSARPQAPTQELPSETTTVTTATSPERLTRPSVASFLRRT